MESHTPPLSALLRVKVELLANHFLSLSRKTSVNFIDSLSSAIGSVSMAAP